jgi:hypothetical protein
LFVALATVHFFIFGRVTIESSVAHILVILVAIVFTASINDFWARYLVVMSGLAWLSLLFHALVMLGVDLIGFADGLNIASGSPGRETLVVHNFLYSAPYRNCGFFWEPGAFAGYLSLALLAGTFRQSKAKLRWVHFWGITGALITTFSTVGIVCLAVLTVLFVYQRINALRFDAKVFLLPVIATPLIAISVYLFDAVPFLGEKILHQISEAANQERSWQINRFGSFIQDLQLFVQQPIWGWSFSNEPRSALVAVEVLAAQGNGLSGFLVDAGAIGLCVYFLFAGRALAREYGTTLELIICLLIVALALNGQQFLNYPVFWALTLSKRQIFSSKSVPSIRRTTSFRQKPKLVPLGAARDQDA